MSRICGPHLRKVVNVTDLKDDLHRLYSDASKHSIYQNIPDFVSNALGYVEPVNNSWRSDRPRLAYLLQCRHPQPGERWLDFGANTGFFTLSLAEQFPRTQFIAVEANMNHARFIEQVSQHFKLDNVSVISKAFGLADLPNLPKCDFLLNLNVVHHVGHDFDQAIVARREDVPDYVHHHLSALSTRSLNMLFQMGTNWGGVKTEPLVDAWDDVEKLKLMFKWIHDSGWNVSEISYPYIGDCKNIKYENIHQDVPERLKAGMLLDDVGKTHLSRYHLENFAGEFYRRPLFLCETK